jgi:hypothetical protein
MTEAVSLPMGNGLFGGRKAVTQTLPCLRLKTELWRRGIRQIDLALSIGIDPSRLSKYMNGREEMPGEVRKSIAAFLGMPEGELF